MKDPYIGLYNFVGGKVDVGEDSTIAAYRELYEETGISREDIRLYRLMDITYYHQEFILELYVGKLSGEKELIAEANPLVWLPLTDDFANPRRFAGEQNITHIVNVALKHPLKGNENHNTGKRLKMDSLCIGVDGCKGGWITAIISSGELRIEKFASVDEIVGRYEKFDEFLIDMVIGLPSNNDHIRPDTAARKLIPGRTPTIFAVPCRQAVYAESEQEKIEKNKINIGKGLVSQTMAIMPKMRELDSFLNSNTRYKNIIKESHPEVCFSRLNGKVVMSKKDKKDGRDERIQILKKYLPELTDSFVYDIKKSLRCEADDIIDAICLAITANLNVQGKCEIIPKEPMEDDAGLIMRMVIPVKDI